MDTISDEELDTTSEPHGERYFVAKTSNGLCAVNYPPDNGRYIGGPFMTWQGACAYIGIYRNNLRIKWIQRGMWLASAAAMLTLSLILWSWLV